MPAKQPPSDSRQRGGLRSYYVCSAVSVLLQVGCRGVELIRWTPDPVIVTIRDYEDYIGVLLYSYYTTITGRGVILRR